MSMPDVSKIMAYEQGELDEDETIELFQQLVDSGVAWRLQGSYGRTAAALIEDGLVTVSDPDDDEFIDPEPEEADDEAL